jgi:hypothetical protein
MYCVPEHHIRNRTSRLTQRNITTQPTKLYWRLSRVPCLALPLLREMKRILMSILTALQVPLMQPLRPNNLKNDSVIPFDLNHDDPFTNVPSQDDATSTLDSQAELICRHYRLGHLSFANIHLMAAKGEIPKRLATCQVPLCQSCLYYG